MASQHSGHAGIAVSACLALLLILQRAETGHWKAESGHLEQLYGEQKAVPATTVANIRAATAAARAADRQAADRVAAEQRAINERTKNDFEARLAAACVRADRLRVQAPAAPAYPGRGGTASVPGLPATTGSTAEAADENGLPAADALTATEQAIQLDELITWVRRQAAIDNKPQGQDRH